MRDVRAVLGVVVLGLAALVTAGTSGAVAAITHRAPPTNSRSAHVSYAGCPAKDIELTVILTARTYVLGQNVRYSVRLHNLGATACSLGAPTHPELGLPRLQLGPCSSLPLAVENARGAQVFPDAGGLACPALIGPTLAPHATLRGGGTWDRVEGALRPAHMPTPAPPGRYHLVIGRVVSVPFVLTNAPPLAALTARVGHRAAGPVVRTAHVAYAGCSARSVTLTVALAPPTTAHTVVARVSLRNGSEGWCGPHRSTGSLDIGLCGSVSAVVHDASDVDVYPGNELVFCPDDTGRGVAPHAHVSGSFRWTGQEDLGAPGGLTRWRQAPPGRYTLEVAGAVQVPFTLPG